MTGERPRPTAVRHDLAPGPALSPAAWLRFDVVRPMLELPRRCRILEIGPGRGAVAARLVSAGHDYSGVELSDDVRRDTATMLGSLGGDARVVATLDELPRDLRFDVLCAFEVLEHIEDDHAALADWVARLEPGALVVLSVPAWPERFSVTDEEVGHLRRYAPEDLRSLAAAAGLVDIEVRLYGFPLGSVLEPVRDQLTRRARRRRRGADESAIERTKRSGAWHQPPVWMNPAVRAGTWPFRMVQRRVPDRGTGLVLRSRVAAQ